ncbi:hypothetical protein DFJ74DRAFT_774298 [Hyaloraphidium curvatum]|nr:hypothetical protein DFJ74DRAFT_774298 [Hyaloraphidium curvatum]
MASASDLCPAYAPVLGSLGAALAMGLSSLGAAVALSPSARIAPGDTSDGAPLPPSAGLRLRQAASVLMSLVLAVYGAVGALVIAGGLERTGGYPAAAGGAALGAGLCVGLACIGAGWALGAVAGVAEGNSGTAREGVLLGVLMVAAESIGLCGLAVGLVVNAKGAKMGC